jgi:hypothetical protein
LTDEKHPDYLRFPVYKFEDKKAIQYEQDKEDDEADHGL